MSESVLVHVSGHDRPGLAAGLMAQLAEAKADIVDIEQITIRERLHLSLLVQVPTGRDILKELLYFGWQHGLSVDFELVESPSVAQPASHEAWAVTLLAQHLDAGQLAAATAAIAGAGANIERIICLSHAPVRCYELTVSGGKESAMRTSLLRASRQHRFDVAVQREGLGRRALRLVAMDVDSTLIQDEAIDLLAELCDCGEAVADVTRRAMAGELDFTQALRERVALLAGLEVERVHQARRRLRLTPGAETFVGTLKRLGFRLAIMSGGFTLFTDPLKAELGVDYAFANTLEIHDGRLTGRVIGPVVDRKRKAEALVEVARAEGIELDQTVAVGDGANDLDMLATAGLGIAFNAKPLVQEAADTAVTVPFLDAVLFVLGIRPEGELPHPSEEATTSR